MTAPLQGLEIWCTRPGRPGERSSRRLHELGAVVIHAPTLSIESVEPPVAELAEVHRRAAELVVAATSPASISNFVDVCTARRPDASPWPVMAVGRRTGLRAIELGLELVGTAPRATAADLVPALLASCPHPVVLIPGSNLRRPELGDRLREAGREVLELLVQVTRHSRTLPTRARERLDGTGLLLVYSPSALGFLDELDPAEADRVRALPVAALGPTTAARARELGLTVAVEPSDPDEDLLFEQIAKWWARRGS